MAEENQTILSNALPQGKKLKEYTIIRKLGQGGFGITYLAHDTIHNCEVVIKENMPNQIARRYDNTYQVGPIDRGPTELQYKNILERFMKEAGLLSKLYHPYIVPVKATFCELGTAYYVMPYIEGNELHKAAPKSNQIDEKWLKPVLHNILKALAYLHKKGLLHRDLKPQNILLSEDNTPILIDFGTARTLDVNPQITQMTQIGTMGYSPAEQFTTSGKLGAWSDLYALGATCYHLITGNIPPDYISRMLTPDCCPPLAGRPELSKRFSQKMLKSIDKAFSIKPEERWDSATNWMKELNMSEPEQVNMPSIPAPETIHVTHEYYVKGTEAILCGEYTEGFKAYQAGHLEGDPNCTVQLAYCYKDGLGTAISHQEFLTLARHLESRKCVFSSLLLAIAYADGLGCSVDFNRAESYARQWLDESTKPIPGIHEDCRLSLRALGFNQTGIAIRWDVQLQQSNGNDLPPIDRLQTLREWAESPDSLAPYQAKFMLWKHTAADSELPTSEIIEGLHKEKAKGHIGALVMLGISLLKSSKAADKKDGQKLIAQAAQKTHDPEMLLAQLSWTQEEKEIKNLLNNIWLSMQYGNSQIVPENAHSCQLQLVKPNIAGIFLTYNEAVVDRQLKQGKWEENVALITAPKLKIINKGKALRNLSLRVVLLGYYEKTFAIQEKSDPDKELEIELSDFSMDWNPHLRIELRNEGKFVAQLTPTSDIWEYSVPKAPIVFPYWEKGFFGSIIVCLKSLSGTYTNVQLSSIKNVTSTTSTIEENGNIAKFGWMEMSDSNAPSIGEKYIVTCDEADPIIIIPTSADKESSCTFSKIAKAAGAFAIGVLTSS